MEGQSLPPPPVIPCPHPSHRPPPKKQKKRQSLYRKYYERHPICFKLTWASTLLLGVLTVIGANSHVTWKIFSYILFIVGCVVVFITVAIHCLKSFGKELHTELGGAMLGQINSRDRIIGKERRESRRESNMQDIIEATGSASFSTATTPTCPNSATTTTTTVGFGPTVVRPNVHFQNEGETRKSISHSHSNNGVLLNCKELT